MEHADHAILWGYAGKYFPCNSIKKPPFSWTPNSEITLISCAGLSIVPVYIVSASSEKAEC